MACKSIQFQLSITSEEYLAYYQGLAKEVIVQASDGRSIRFPANAIQRFLQPDGISGQFEIRFTNDNKLLEVVRLKERL